MDVSAARCPVSLIGGRLDMIVSSDDMAAVGRTLPEAKVTLLSDGTHQVPLQYPDLMLDELRQLADRAIAD